MISSGIGSSGKSNLSPVYSEPYNVDRSGRYRVLEAVGRGSFGEVLLALDKQAPTQVDKAKFENFGRANGNCGRKGGEELSSRHLRRIRSLKRPASQGEELRDQDAIPRIFELKCPSDDIGRTYMIPGRKLRSSHNPSEGRNSPLGLVALKKVSCMGGGRGWEGGLARGFFREMRTLEQLGGHPNIVHLFDVYPEGSTAVLVLEYMPSDLGQVLENTTCPLAEAVVKAFACMMLRGLSFIHSKGLLHRDLKPSNLLISKGGVLKIADFGQARTHHLPQSQSYSHQVATRWYRAPELLYGSRRYGYGVDMWSAGAVIGEMFANRPIFPGQSDIDQIHCIMEVLGTPSDENWPASKYLPDFGKISFPFSPPKDPKWVFPGVSPEGVGLVMSLLKLDPERRCSAAESLSHRFFFTQPTMAKCCELQPGDASNSWGRKAKVDLEKATGRGGGAKNICDEGFKSGMGRVEAFLDGLSSQEPK